MLAFRSTPILSAFLALGVGGVIVEGRVHATYTPVEAAMAELISAIAEQDAQRVLACFSKKTSWYLTTTGEGEPRRTRYSYQKLEAGLRDDGDFRGVILGDTPDDSLRDQVEATKRRPWRAYGRNTFVPPDGNHEVYVRWHKEGGRFVVAEIAFPGA